MYGKLAYMCAIVLGTVTVGYPFLHEEGHYMAAWLLGAQAVELHLFPTPFVVCTVAQPSRAVYTAVGLAGSVLPMGVFLFRPRGFTAWFISETIKCAVAIAWFTNALAVVYLMQGVEWANDDMVQIVKHGVGTEGWWLFVSVAAGLLCIWLFLRDKPLQRLLTYF